MKTILALVAAASTTLASASLANAQECLNGWRELGNQVIVKCDEGLAPQAGFLSGQGLGSEEEFVPEASAAAAPLPEEPLYTGSISSAAEPQISPPPPQIAATLQVEGPWACESGKYWMLESEGSSRPMMC
ncbi:MAG: hypothetical protein ACRED5_04245 [Propylenella sp.]